MTATVVEGGRKVVEVTGGAGERLFLPLGASCRRWSPQDPFLYTLQVRVISRPG